MRLVIIGNGMAATRLITSLTGRAAGHFAITVIGDEPEHAYNRIQLSPVLGGEKAAADICLQDDEWYQAHGVTVLRGEKAIAVNVDTREVQTAARTLGWDALVFATGSSPAAMRHTYSRFVLWRIPGPFRQSPVRRWCWGAACSGLRWRQPWRAQVTASRLFIAVRG